jgi:hypothetical protein
MIESYQRIVAELQEHGIAVLLLHQVVIHPDIEGLWSLSEMERYHKELQKFATEQNVLLSDPLPFCPVVDRCFEEKEWYSIEGHQAAFLALQQHSTFLLGIE